MLLWMLACSGVETDPDDVLFNVNALAEGPPRTDIVIENRRPQPLELRFDTGTGSVYAMVSPQGERFTLDQRDNARWPRACDNPCSDPDVECEPPMETPWPVLAGGSETFDWNGDLRRFTDTGCFETFRPEGSGWTLELKPRPFEREGAVIARVAVDFPVERIVLPVPVDLGSASDPQALLEQVKAQIGEAPSSWADLAGRPVEGRYPVLSQSRGASVEIGSVVYELARAEETWELMGRRGEDTLWAAGVQDLGDGSPQTFELQVAGDLVLVWGVSGPELLVQAFHRDDGRSMWAWSSVSGPSPG
jgi:hypothetical protein